MQTITITGQAINAQLRDRCLRLDAENRELTERNLELHATLDGLHTVIEANDQLQVEARVSRLSNNLLRAELRRLNDLLPESRTPEYVQFLRYLEREERAMHARLTRRAS